MSQFVLGISKIDKRDIDIAGKFAVELGELSHIGIPIPEGFIVTAGCFREFLIGNKITPTSSEKQIMHIPMSKDLAHEINNAYKELGSTFRESKVSVVSSSPFSFKNIHYEVKGDANLILKIKEIWASQFSKISLLENNINHPNDFHKLDIAIVVQKKIQNEKSGKIFTQDPLTSDRSKIVIEQDRNISHYLMSKKNLDIIFKGHLTKERLHKISDKEAHALAIFGKKIEKHFYFPQEIRFAIDKNKIYILETKPMTNIISKPSPHSVAPPVLFPNSYPHYPKLSREHTKRDILLKGICAFPGIATGRVRVYKNSKAIHNVIPSEILVVPKIEANLFPIIKKARGLITESVSFTNHDKTVYRKFVGRPIIQGAKNATVILHTGNVVTLNGTKGEIYKGGLN